jgi:hypothetical protein
MLSTINKNFNLSIIFIYILFVFNYDFGYPVEVIPDETSQLKMVYDMLQHKSLYLNYSSSYSVWVGYILLPFTMVYWGVFYLFSDLNNIPELQKYVLENYFQVIPYLRLYIATLFFVSLLLIRKMAKDIVGCSYANLLFLFISTNLIVIIGTHEVKHWVSSLSLVFISLYLYHAAFKNNKPYFKISSYFLMCWGLISTSALAVFLIFYFPIFYHYNKRNKDLVFDMAGFVFIAIMMVSYTYAIASGGLYFDGSIKLDTDRIWIYKYFLYYLWDYNMVLFVFGIFSIAWTLVEKKYAILSLFLIPLIFFLIAISMHGYIQPRYTLPIVVLFSFIAAFWFDSVSRKHRKISNYLLVLYLALSLSSIFWWLHIIGKDDTRVQARNWMVENVSQNSDFVIYNTWGFNYLPLTKKSIQLMDGKFKGVNSTREKLHVKYDLTDGYHGVILWKYIQSGHKLEDLIAFLKENKFQVFLVDEHFGNPKKLANFGHPNKLQMEGIEDSLNGKGVKKFSSYRTKMNSIDNTVGDILIQFKNPFYTFGKIARTGPEITIYKL